MEGDHTVQQKKNEHSLTVVTPYKGSWYHPQESDYKQPGRSIESVVLCTENGKNEASAVLKDCEEFLASPGHRGHAGFGTLSTSVSASPVFRAIDGSDRRCTYGNAVAVGAVVASKL